jgi:hypothetical protein
MKRPGVPGLFFQAGISNAGVNLTLALRGFFDNGGRQCFVSQIAPGDPLESGLGAFDGHDVSVVCCPDDATIATAAVMARYCDAEGSGMHLAGGAGSSAPGNAPATGTVVLCGLLPSMARGTFTG